MQSQIKFISIKGLYELLYQPISKNQILDLTLAVKGGKIDICDLLELSFDKNEQTAFRSSWILENVFLSYPDIFFPYTKQFLAKFSSQTNFSCCRHYGKILAGITHKKAQQNFKNILVETNTSELATTVFGWLIDEKMPVAVKSHCLNILANLSVKHLWIKEELLETMDFLVDKESIAFFAKVKQIRKQLKA